MRKKTHVVAGLFLAYLFKFDPVLVVAGAIMPDIDYIYQHRKLLHNLFLLACAFLYNIQFGVGYLSHILLDMLTVYGVALLWPISSKRFRFARFSTGGFFDTVLFVIFLLGWVLIDINGFVHIF